MLIDIQKEFWFKYGEDYTKKTMLKISQIPTIEI